MADLSYTTAGESHGRAVLAVVNGMPAGLTVDEGRINDALRRRQGGYGRGGRMKIEQDSVTIVSGIRNGVTIGSPVTLLVNNKDFRIDSAPEVNRPRPGHADLAGSIKWKTTDCRNTLERASARETAARVAAGALASCLLAEVGIDVVGYVLRIGEASIDGPIEEGPDAIRAARDANEAYCPDQAVAQKMLAAIKQAKKDKDTLGGIVEVQVHHLPAGLGSCMRWQDKLDGRLMQAVGSIQAIKGVEIGLGFEAARRPGSAVHDEIDFDKSRTNLPSLGFVRRSNNAGGVEGGMTNGQPVVVRAAMKPISTLLRGMESVNLKTLSPERSDYERSDVCAVPAASVVTEFVVAFEMARAFLEKFGGDTLGEVKASYRASLEAALAMQNEAES